MKVRLKEQKSSPFKEGEKDKTNKVIGHADFLFLFKFKDGKGKILEIFFKVAITTITIILNAIVIILLVKLFS
jgi:hypothetical protein